MFGDFCGILKTSPFKQKLAWLLLGATLEKLGDFLFQYLVTLLVFSR